MGILDKIFTPKWKNKDSNLRLEAIHDMADDDRDILLEMALTDEDEEVQVAACKKISDVEGIQKIATSARGKAAAAAHKKLNKIAKDKILHSDDPDWQEMLGAIDDEHVMVDIVIETTKSDIRTAALERIESKDSFFKIATGKCGKDAGMKAIAQINDEEMLKSLTTKGANKAVRNAAERKLLELNPPEGPSKDEVNGKELLEIVDYAESVKGTYNFDGVGKMLAEKGARWKDLDPAGTSELTERFNAAIAEFEGRRAEFEAKQADQVRKLEEQGQIRQSKAALCEEIEVLEMLADDTPEKLERLKADWDLVGTLSDEDEEDELNRRFERGHDKHTSGLKKISGEQEFYARLEAKCADLEQIAAGDDMKKIRKHAKDEWREVNFDFMDAAPIQARFKKAVSAMKSRIENAKAEDAKKREEAEANAAERKAALEAIIASTEEQVDAEDRRAAGNKIREEQDKWKELEGWKDEKLATKYRAILDKFWEKQREFLQEEEWNEWANKGIKDELIQIAEKLSLLEDLPKVAKVIRKLQEKWKATGPVPHADNEPMWKRFHAACDANYARCKEFFDEKDKVRGENMEYCTKLADEAEQLLESEDLKASVKRFKELQADWKAHGQLPKGKGDELYQRFRTACDQFFARFGEHLEEVDSHRDENQAKKEELIAKVEALIAAEGDSNAKECIAIQTEWKTIGAGTRERDDKTWKKFREVCDKFFASLEADREQNIAPKIKICEEAEKMAEELNDETDRRELTNKVVEIQSKWKKIGPAPKAKQDELWNRFRSACDKLFEIDRESVKSEGGEREQNLALKKQLIARAEQISTSTDWKDTGDELREIQAKWKIIGQVPREHDKETWQSFRAACDIFFDRRKKHFDQMDSKREENLQAKEGLLSRLEMIVAEETGEEAKTKESSSSSNLDLAAQLQVAFENNFAMTGSGTNSFDEVKRIQERWKELGPVPREHDKDLWNRYRAACDAFYGNRRGDNKAPSEQTAEQAAE